jgi:hypothetical protein
MSLTVIRTRKLAKYWQFLEQQIKPFQAIDFERKN